MPITFFSGKATENLHSVHFVWSVDIYSTLALNITTQQHSLSTLGNENVPESFEYRISARTHRWWGTEREMDIKLNAEKENRNLKRKTTRLVAVDGGSARFCAATCHAQYQAINVMKWSLSCSCHRHTYAHRAQSEFIVFHNHTHSQTQWSLASMSDIAG